MRKIVATAALRAGPCRPSDHGHSMTRQGANVRNLLMALAMAVTFGSAGIGQEKSPLPETWGRYSPGWGHEWMSVSVALNPDGSVSSRVPDRSRKNFEEKIARFERLFGSASEHGLEDGTVAPTRFCPPKGTISWGDKIAENLGAILLLSEVAAKATIESVALGFGTGGYPKALVRLADAEPLTNRSPIPEYVVLPIGQLVTHDRVFCANRGPIGTGDYRGPYQPQAGSQIVVIGRWRDGTVFLGPSDAWYAELNEGALEWRFGGYGRYGNRTLKGMKNLVSRLETRGLFERTDHLTKAEEHSMERVRFGQAWARAVQRGCEPTVVRDGGETVECETEQ